jgi:hypothetical protein
VSSIESIVEAREGEAGPWRVTRVVNREGSALMDDVFQLWHYSTCMLEWLESEAGSTLTRVNTGRGSVSDQNGVNKALRVLGINMRYHRDKRGGGARIV